MRKQGKRPGSAPGSRVTVRGRGAAVTITPVIPLDQAWWLEFFRAHPEALQAVEMLASLGFDMLTPQSPAFQDIVLEESARAKLYRQVLRLAKAYRVRQLKEVVKEG